MHRKLNLLFVFFYFFSSHNVGSAGDSVAGTNPFTPKASLIRYWNKEIRNNLPKPEFLISKASPMTAVEAAAFSKLAAQNALSAHLPSFCTAANLLCFPELSASLEKHDKDSNFAVYQNRNFTNYGTDGLGGANSFKNYSNGENLPIDSFRRYSRDSAGHDDEFTNYALNTNVVDQSFNTYGAGATGGVGDFKSYNTDANSPNLRFNFYGSDSNGRLQKFTGYTEDTNSGSETFSSYGKNGNGAPNEFTGYGKGSNVIESGFSGYGESGNGANDTFTSYGEDGNVPENNFKSYGNGGNGEIDNFKSYRDESNVGDDSFKSYAKNSNSAEVNFDNYGESFNGGPVNFTGYGEAAQGQAIGFTKYGLETDFKKYAKEGVKFSTYKNDSSELAASMAAASGKKVNKWVEPGKFFREKMLKEGTVMPMPDIRDKMPKRSFLSRPILLKLPFSTSKISDLKQIFHAVDNSTMEKILNDALRECERAPSRGETKRCVASIEDMIDFSTSVLGRNIRVRTTQNTNGSKQSIMVGSVKGINGGLVTESVSCHQSLFPYLLYYCHSVPKVRVYEADILDSNSKSKINHGVAICHVDTSAWSSGHGAFLALGSGPGQIEVCHWIFENDMTWTIAD